MIFPDRIKSIKPNYKVLEIGPGAYPHPRSNVFLDKNFTTNEAFIQSGYMKPIEILDKPIHYYDGRLFPFDDDEFDYVICSHVVEHVPIEDLDLFISEIKRVSKHGGYLEFPNIYYELLCFPDGHQWFVNYRDKEILFLKRKEINENNILKIYHSMIYGNDKYVYKIYNRYKEFFITGFEWTDNITYKIVNSFDELITHQDVEKWTKYFNNFQPEKEDISYPKIIPYFQYQLKRIIRILKKMFRPISNFH